MKIRKRPLKGLRHAPYNPRVRLKPGDHEYEQLKKSIQQFGYVEPIIFNVRTGNVVGGHQRLEVLRDLGHTEAEVVEIDLSLAEEKALNVALNKINGRWDESKLADLLTELGKIPDFDVSLTGFEAPEIQSLLDRVLAGVRGPGGGNDGDFDVSKALDTSKPAITKPGELIVLGAQRLICGDCTDHAVVKKLMEGRRAVLFATDPPYCVGYDGTNHPTTKTSTPARKQIANKDWSGSYGVSWDDAEANPELYRGFIKAAIAEAIRPDAAWYCWHASRRQAMLEAVWSEFDAFVHCQIIWQKNRGILTRSMYMWQHEPCFFGWVKGKKPPRTKEPMRSTIWAIDTIPNGPERPDHPTPKPVEVFTIPMGQHTGPGDICYEPFAGSGTQIVAAEQLGRRCFAVEISPHYCDVIVRRWLHLVGPANAPRALVDRYRVRDAAAADSNRPSRFPKRAGRRGKRMPTVKTGVHS